jgi:hypothetical protein
MMPIFTHFWYIRVCLAGIMEKCHNVFENNCSKSTLSVAAVVLANTVAWHLPVCALCFPTSCRWSCVVYVFPLLKPFLEFFTDLEPLKMKATCWCETSRTSNPVMQHHTPVGQYYRQKINYKRFEWWIISLQDGKAHAVSNVTNVSYKKRQRTCHIKCDKVPYQIWQRKRGIKCKKKVPCMSQNRVKWYGDWKSH